MTDWKETTLWKHLEKASGPEVDAARALLIQEMPRIQTILTQAHTAPTDFTLHDADHSFRVAKWMAEIIPSDVLEKLSPYEITLLLLAAYLHDIGMTPEQGRVERFWYHLVYGAPDPKSRRQPLTDEEARDLQGWLDDGDREITIPLAPDGAASEATKRHADLLIAHYCRHKHNDWSAEWIKAHLRRESLPGYDTWVDDLVQLCRSHHEGYDELKQGRFDPRPAGPSGRPVHHRYLACVLRVADVLEIDPERTPEVIFRHREIHPGSVLYWRKDHENWLIRDGKNLVLTTYPDRAVIENAIRRTAEGIQQELATCARLNREQPFFYWQLRPTQPMPHRWNFPEVLTVHVQPRSDAYVYIDGAFRPNTEKLLELLSGTRLYGNSSVAVRELLQNAFDAVKEEMAYQRLERPGDQEFAKSLANLHRVELRLEKRDGRPWLICKDTGVGMTRRIIENYLLVSGNSRRREIVELERRCREAGFRLGRTGQFGIGVLSYFMLADRVEICTRRSAARADAEANGWSFVTEGVGSFGELKKEQSASSGTEVRLRLRSWEVTSKGKLERYLKETIRYIPCTLGFYGLDNTEEAILWKAGWVHSLEESVKDFLKDPDQLFQSQDFIPSAKRAKVEARQRFFVDWFKAAREALRWKEEEGELPNNLGTYRIAVPWFELPGGRCEAFMFMRSESRRRVIMPLAYGSQVGILPRFRVVESIHGMRLDDRSDDIFGVEKPGFQEINWESSNAGRLRVNRNSLDLSPLADDTARWVETRAHEILKGTLIEKPSEYTFLSESWLKGLGGEPCWAIANPGKTPELVWSPLAFPVALAKDMEIIETPVFFRGKTLTVLSPLQLHEWSMGALLPSFLQSGPEKLLPQNQRSSSFGIIRLWEKISDSGRQCPLGKTSQLPPEWGELCGVRFDGRSDYELIWNVDHSIVSRVDKEAVMWLEKIKGRSYHLDLAALGEDIFATPGRAARALAWVLAETPAEDRWAVLLERDSRLTRKLLHVVLDSSDAGEAERAIGFLKADGGQWKLIILAADSVMMASPGDPLFEEFLPPPGPDWVITETDSDDEPT